MHGVSCFEHMMPDLQATSFFLLQHTMTWILLLVLPSTMVGRIQYSMKLCLSGNTRTKAYDSIFAGQNYRSSTVVVSTTITVYAEASQQNRIRCQSTDLLSRPAMLLTSASVATGLTAARPLYNSPTL